MSGASLRKDRRVKAPLYAAADVPEYWTVNLRERTVEVYRDPSEGTYCSLTTLRSADTIRPHAFPDIDLRISDFMARS